MQRAIRQNGAVAGYHINLGAAYRTWGKFPEAIASYRRAMKLDPNIPELHHNLGVLLQDQGELDKAVASYRRALETETKLCRGVPRPGQRLASPGQAGRGRHLLPPSSLPESE